MSISTERIEEKFEIKRFPIKYPLSSYTFPKEARIKAAQIDPEYVHIDLTDGRKLSIPLHWIPSLFNAPQEEREKYEINGPRTMLVWNPEDCAINDELRISDYLN